MVYLLITPDSKGVFKSYHFIKELGAERRLLFIRKGVRYFLDLYGEAVREEKNCPARFRRIRICGIGPRALRKSVMSVASPSKRPMRAS